MDSPSSTSGASGRSLRTALILRTLLPLLLVLGGATALLLLALEREMEERLQEDVELVARGLRLPVSDALARGGTEALIQALQSTLEIRRVYGAHLYGPDGERLASFGAGLPDEDPAQLDELLATGEQVGRYGRTAGRRVYSFFVPLTDSWERPLGLLQVTRRRSDIDDSIRRLRLQAAGFLLLGLSLVSVLILRGHHRAIGAPLLALGRSMGRIRAGERDHRAEVIGPRELADVSRTFNSMLESMDVAESELARRREAQVALRKELAQAEKMAAVGELAGGIAHELGSPLSVIDGTVQRKLRESERDGNRCEENGRDALEAVRTEVRRMEGIIRQLLEFGRRESGRRQHVPLDGVVRRAAGASAPEAERLGVRIDVDGDPAGVRVEADPRRFEEALTHLVRNACQAAAETDPPHRVRLSSRVDVPRGSGPRRGRVAVLDVEDSGPGIDEEIASRVFEPFFTTKPTGKGTGLGLAVAHAVFEGMGVEVELGRSALGGARFTLRFPLSEEGRSPVPGEGKPPMPDEGTGHEQPADRRDDGHARYGDPADG